MSKSCEENGENFHYWLRSDTKACVWGVCLVYFMEIFVSFPDLPDFCTVTKINIIIIMCTFLNDFSPLYIYFEDVKSSQIGEDTLRVS